MPRRYIDYPEAFAYWNHICSIGYAITAVGVLVFLVDAGRDVPGAPQGRRQSVGRGRDDARMDALLAAALPPVQRTAGDQAGRAPLRERRGRRQLHARTASQRERLHRAAEAARDVLVVFTALVGYVAAPGAGDLGARLRRDPRDRRRRRRLGRAQHVVRRRHRRGDGAHARAPDPRRPRAARRSADARASSSRCSR